jgi:hypothetical protein
MKNLTILILCPLAFISACTPIDQAMWSRSVVEVEVDERIYRVNRYPGTEDTWVTSISPSNQGFVAFEYLNQADQRITAIERVSECKVVPRSVVHINSVITTAKVSC